MPSPARRPRRCTATVALTALLLLALPATSGADIPVLGCADAAARIDDRCESWAVAHDPEPDADEPYQQPSAAAVGDGLLAVAGYGAQDLFASGGQARSRWRILGLDPATGEQRWMARPGPTDAYARPADIAVSRDGTHVFATGWSSSAFGARDAHLLVVALDAASGEALWESTMTAPALGLPGTDARGWYVEDTGTGALLVVGTFGAAGRDHFQQVAFVTVDAATGEVLATRIVPGVPPTGTTYPVGMAVTADGRTGVVATTSDGPGEYNIDMVTAAVDLADASDPQVTWVHRYDHLGHQAPDRAQAMALDPAGARVYVTGISGNDTDGPPFTVDYDLATLALDVATGSILWESRQDLGAAFPQPNAVAADGDRVVAVGARIIDGRRMGYASAIDAADGTPLWTEDVTTSTGDNEVAHGVAITADEVVVTGSSASTKANTALLGLVYVRDTLTVGLAAADGARRWTATHNATGSADEAGYDVLRDGDGNAWVLGRLTRSVEADRNFYDLQVLAYLRR